MIPLLLLPDVPLAPYPAWRSAGDAFRLGPASGDLIRKLEIENAKGEVFSSEIEGDRPTGALLSPHFKIERRYLAFRIGGGTDATGLQLLLDGKPVATVTGRRSDRLRPDSLDLKRWLGKKAQVRIFDHATGDWGHVNVEGLVQTDRPEKLPMKKASLYEESLRPQFHFTARQWTQEIPEPGQRQEGWINDLNGLIYYEGEYHLFAQRWAKCWLHAVSRDLVHWEELPPAFWEESEGSGVQSGTCVIDYDNTSGLGKGAMVAFWSRFDNRSQCLHYSLDKGRTWTAYAGNPYMFRPERDPKVFWHTPSGHWVMMLYGEGKYHILTSKDLLHWTDEKNPIPDCFECPDFFELPLDGDPAQKKWVLIQGNGKYSLGSFDGKRFTDETARRPCDVGPNFYATQSWHNVKDRRVQAAWMRADSFPDMPFNQQISFPCELTLRTTSAGPRIFREPVKELELLHGKPRTFAPRTLENGGTLTLATKGDLYRLRAEVEIHEDARLVLILRGTTIAIEPKTPDANPVRSFDVLLDRASIETFLNHGELSRTQTVLPTAEGLSLRAEGGTVTLRSLALIPLKSIWPKVPPKP